MHHGFRNMEIRLIRRLYLVFYASHFAIGDLLIFGGKYRPAYFAPQCA